MLPPSGWPNPDRYRNHRALVYSPPPVRGNLPPLLIRADKRLPKLFTSRTGRFAWAVTGIHLRGDPEAQARRGAKAERVRQGLRYLHFHADKRTTAGQERQRRDQALHSAFIVLRYLLTTCNVRPSGRELDWLECRPTTHAHIAKQTGLSLTTTREAETLLSENAFLRIERQFETLADGTRRELPARRWITPHLFAALGLGKAYTEQLTGRKQAHRQTAAAVAPAPTAANTAPAKHITPQQRSKAHRELSQVRALLGGRPPTKPPS